MEWWCLSLLSKTAIPAKIVEAIAYSCEFIAKTKEIRLLKDIKRDKRDNEILQKATEDKR